MTDVQLIQLWNLLFPDNDSREISEKDLRDGLVAFLNTLSARIGSLPSLQTNQKASIVLAINELVLRIGNLENRFAPQAGDADPNQVPPPGPFDYGSIYIQQENQGGNIVDIAFWLYTNVSPGWLNLSDFLQPIIKLEFEPNEIYNFPAAKKGQSFGIKINDGNNDLPNGYALLGGPLGVYIGNDTLLFALQDSPNGNFADVGGNFLIINGLKETVIVNDLPATGLEVQTYVRKSDNTFWRWTNGGVFPYPTPQFIRLTPLEVHTHSFVYDGSNNVRTLEHPIHEEIDLIIENGCNYNYVEPFTPGATEITIKPTDLLEGQKIKLIYK